jgi:hypothetical protein
VAEVEIRDGMSAGATPFFAEDFVGRKVVAVHEVKGGLGESRCEVLLLLEDGLSCLISCDPIVHDDEGVKLPSEEWGKRGWEVVLYDTTNVKAGIEARKGAGLP